jgi:hypothetical protein
MRHQLRPSRVSSITAPTAGQLHRRARSPAPVLAPLKPYRDGKAVVPVRRVGPCDCRRRDEVEVFRVRRGAAGPIHRAHQGDRTVDHHCLGVCDPRLSVDPDGHARSGQRLDTICRRARRGLVGNQPDIDAVSLGANQRLDDARARCQAIGANQDLAFGVVDRTDREGGAVLLWGKADGDCCPDVTEAAGRAGESVARESDRTRENTPKLWRISPNSLLPCPRAHQIGMPLPRRQYIAGHSLHRDRLDH